MIDDVRVVLLFWEADSPWKSHKFEGLKRSNFSFSVAFFQGFEAVKDDAAYFNTLPRCRIRAGERIIERGMSTSFLVISMSNR